MIEVEYVDSVAVVRLAHGKVNALDLELVTAIAEAFRALDSREHEAVVLTGVGRTFSAGVDLWRVLDDGPGYVARFLPALVDAFEAVFAVGKPVVAAINGHAIAGGCIFAACCDYRMMADDTSRIGVTELLVGVPFPVTALEILRYALGGPRARAVVLGGNTYRPAIALGTGMVDELVAPGRLLERSIGYARRLADQVPGDTYRFTKRQLQLDTAERIARLRPEQDPETVRLWQARVEDGAIREYMERITARRTSAQRG
jgi:enoyl-CoA hydratase